MAIGQFMPMFSLGSDYQADPYAEYVVMSLDMNTLVGGAPVDKSNMPTAFVVGGAPVLDAVNTLFGKPTIQFSGTGQYYHQARPTEAYYDFFASTDFCVDAWFIYQPNSTATTRILSHKTTQTWNEPEIIVLTGASGGKYRITLNIANGDRITSGYIITPGQFHHVSYGRVNGNRCYLYIDGVLIGNYTYATELTNSSLTIAASGFQRNTAVTDKLKGNIASLRWWNGVSPRDGLTNFTPPTAPWGPVTTEFSEASVTSGVGTVSSRTYTGFNSNVASPIIGSLSTQPFPSFDIDTLLMQRNINARYVQLFLASTGVTRKQWLRLACVTPPLSVENMSNGSSIALPKIAFNAGSPAAQLGPNTTTLYDTLFVDGTVTKLRRT